MKKQVIKNDAKLAIKNWVEKIDTTEEISADIIAFSFNLFEPFGIELVGSKQYDKDNEDWACEEDFVPTLRQCKEFEMPYSFTWEEVQEMVIEILKELTIELPNNRVFKAEHIATGFVDGNLVLIK